MGQLWATFLSRKEELLQATIEHLGISVVALLLAMAIAVPLAIWLTAHKKAAEAVLQLTSVLQTIPSLALLGLLIPFVGIGTAPALIALVIYALLPIFQNTYIGLTEIDPSIEEAAVAFGMSRWRRLTKVELPMALPVIISGIRTAFVLIIGTATLAALIGAGGLGTFILLGIDRNSPDLTLIGAVSAAVLAIFFGALIRFLQQKKPRYTLITLAILLLGLGGYEVYANRLQPQTPIVIAGKLGAEPDILINMYQQLIEAEDAEAQVTLKPNFGKTSFLFSALQHGQVDIYPEFSGTVLESLVKLPENQQNKKRNQEETYQDAAMLLKEQFDMAFLPPMAYENTYALAMKKTFAKANGITKISDLAKIQSEVKAGFTLEFIDRSDGYRGIKENYGLDFPSVQSMEPALRYQAINNGDVNLIDAYSTDSEIKQYDLVTLADDRGLFPAYQGAPLMTEAFKRKHPQVVEALSKLAGKITEAEMVALNYQVNVEKKEPADVARNFLVQAGLLKEGR